MRVEAHPGLDTLRSDFIFHQSDLDAIFLLLGSSVHIVRFRVDSTFRDPPFLFPTPGEYR